jgi:hypothetical protein
MTLRYSTLAARFGRGESAITSPPSLSLLRPVRVIPVPHLILILILRNHGRRHGGDGGGDGTESEIKGKRGLGGKDSTPTATYSRLIVVILLLPRPSYFPAVRSTLRFSCRSFWTGSGVGTKTVVSGERPWTFYRYCGTFMFNSGFRTCLSRPTPTSVSTRSNGSRLTSH